MKLTVSLRRCVLGDEIALSLVGQASFLEAFAGTLLASDLFAHCTRQHTVEKYREWLADGFSRLWLAETEPGSGPVGYLVLTRPDLPLADLGPNDWEIKRIYLLHRFQGQGTFRQFVNRQDGAFPFELADIQKHPEFGRPIRQFNFKFANEAIPWSLV